MQLYALIDLDASMNFVEWWFVLGPQDVAVARMIYDLARERGVGTEIPLVGR